MIVSVLPVGKARGLEGPIRAYEDKASRYWKLSVEEVPQTKGRDAQTVMAGEAESLRKRLDSRFRTAVLTRSGRSRSSTELAHWLDELRVGAVPGVHFVIGGAFGLSRALIREADLALSLSPFTLPHDLARLVLAEQLYRAGTILRGEPYHKG